MKMKNPVNIEYLQALIEFDFSFRRDDKITCGDLAALLLTQEAPSRLCRDRFVSSSALESKLSMLPKKQNPQR
jgi:hypothetical protein